MSKGLKEYTNNHRYNKIFYTRYSVILYTSIIFAPTRVYSYDSTGKICEGDAQAIRTYAG